MNIAEFFYTLTESARVLGVERHTVQRWIKDGRLSAQRAGGVVFLEKSAVAKLVSGARNSSARTPVVEA